MKSTLLFLCLVISGAADAANILRRIPIVYSQALDKALVVAVADTGNYWLSECDIAMRDNAPLAEIITDPKGTCRRLRDVELPLSDQHLAETLEAFATSFYREALLQRENGTRPGPIFIGLGLIAAAVGGMMYFTARKITGSNSILPFVPAVILFGTGGVEYGSRYLGSPTQIQPIAENVIGSIRSSDGSVRLIKVERGIYSVYKQALERALDVVGTDQSKIRTSIQP